MRITVAALSLSFMLAAAAFAQDTPRSAGGAGTGAQPQLPNAVSNPTAATPSPAAPTKAMPAGVPPTAAVAGKPPKGFQEPNMKHKHALPDSYLIKDAPLRDDFVMGKKTAPVVLVEYASLSCPHCAHFANDVFPEIQKKYIDTGKLRYVLRQFPLNESALKGAMLLDCVGEQSTEKYYTFAKVLFESQARWAFDANFMSGLETIATVGGLTKDQFASCTSSTDREMKLLANKKLAIDELKIPHTPYIVIGGEALEGMPTVESTSKLIEAKLAAVKK